MEAVLLEDKRRDVPPDQNWIEFRNVSRRFGSIQALSNVSLHGRSGSVHAVTGENGAGKSTLMKILAGVHRADAGVILMGGEPIRFDSPAEARARGIATVFQELTLLPNLTIAENVFLGREPRRAGFVDRAEMHRRTRRILDHVGSTSTPTSCAPISRSRNNT